MIAAVTSSLARNSQLCIIISKIKEIKKPNRIEVQRWNCMELNELVDAIAKAGVNKGQ